MQDGPGEEAKGELALAVGEMVDVDRVDNLFGRDIDIWRKRGQNMAARTEVVDALMIRKSLLSP